MGQIFPFENLLKFVLASNFHILDHIDMSNCLLKGSKHTQKRSLSKTKKVGNTMYTALKYKGIDRFIVRWY